METRDGEVITDHLFPKALNNEDKGCKLKAKNVKKLIAAFNQTGTGCPYSGLEYGSAFKQAARILKYGNVKNFFVTCKVPKT